MQKLFSSNKLQELIKREKISQKPYLTDYSLLIMQDLWQAHVNTNKMIKNMKPSELNTKITSGF